MLKSPFPYFGGKSKIASAVWQHFGDVRNYVEPLFGSGAVLLGRPLPFDGTETVNDADGFVANFWRALQSAPDEVAHYADWPVNENDLHARHAWLVGQKYSMQARLEGDPDWHDAKIAGWWAWGLSCWIGSGFCSGKGPWQVAEVDGVRQLVHLGDAGRGVNRQRLHLGNAGQGVNRNMPNCDARGGKGVVGEKRRSILYEYLAALAERLRRARVCCGDWSRVCGPTPTVKQGLTAVFLDPPYGPGRAGSLYRVDSLSVAEDVRKWAIEHGGNPKLRIALCGYDDVTMPAGWTLLRWKARGGYGVQSNNRGKENRHREAVWFSPHCLSELSNRAEESQRGDLFASTERREA